MKIIVIYLTNDFHIGDNLEEIAGYGTLKPRNLISSILGQSSIKTKTLAISNPHDFRTVSYLKLRLILHFLNFINFFIGVSNYRCGYCA